MPEDRGGLRPSALAGAPTITPGGGFVHEALLYAGDEGFLASTLPFIADGVDGNEPVMVAVGARKIDLLRARLGERADMVTFVDMGEIGGNPARIIPAWQDFLVDRAAGARPVRGIGEPIGPDRTPGALLECQRHEVLLNVAFAGGPAWWLLCPYDITALDARVVDEAVRSHPYIQEDDAHRPSEAYADGDPQGFDRPLPEPPGGYDELHFEFGPLAPVREFVSTHAARMGLTGVRVADLLVAVNELAANSVSHGGGSGRVRIWDDGAELVCEVRDRGRIDRPLAGRQRPGRNGEGGRGLWIVNQVCDLVEMRSTAAGTVVRMHLALG